MNKTQLAAAYKVGLNTLQGELWLLSVPGIRVFKGKQIFTPHQVELIVKHLGPWE